MKIEVFLKQINENLELPKYAKPGDAGMDLRANIKESVILGPGDSAIIPTGIAFALPDGFQCEIRPRSGTAAKNQVTVLNSPGTIDSGYRNEVGVILINHGKKAFRVEPGDRIAQAVFMPFVQAEFTIVDKLDDSVRGLSGFGDSGVK